MRATPLLAAVAAGIFSVSAASAQETAGKPVSSAPRALDPTLIVTIPSTTQKPPASEKADAAEKAASEKSSAAMPAASKPAEVATVPAAPQPAAVKAAESVAAPVARKPAAPSLVVKINLATQRLQLTYDGRTQESWPISSGRADFPTPRGVYRPQWASKMWYSRKYDNAPMPHAVFFTGGVAVHGTQAIWALGSPASHGCIRLAPGNAARFYALVHKHGFTNTRIEVFGNPPTSRIAHRDRAPDVRAASVTRAAPRIQQPLPPTVRFAQPSRPVWVAPTAPRPQTVHRAANGLVYLPPNSPYRGRPSFVMNGVTYVRVR